LDREPAVQVSLRLEQLGDGLGIEAHLGEYLRVRAEEDGGAAAARGADLLERARRLAARERLLPLRAVAAHARHELLREGRDHRGAHAVEPARVIVVLRLELPARV